MRYATHTIVLGDTLQAIAQFYLKDSNRWTEIALLNNLEYPFIVDEFRNGSTPEHVKAIGENLTLPIPEDIQNLPKSELQRGYDRLLGEDIALFKNDELVSDTYEGEMTANQFGDLATYRGIANLKQALMLRFATPLGELLHHPDYGTRLYSLIGDRNSPAHQQKVRVEIERTLRDDARVEDVIIEQLGIQFSTITASIAVKPIGINQLIEMGFRLDQTGVIEWA